MAIYKILRADEWSAFQKAGRTHGAHKDMEAGIIHFSGASQVAETARRHFGGEKDLVLLAVEETKFGTELKWEPSRGGQLFPHLYRPLELAEVLWSEALPLGDDGHVFPENIQ